MKIDQEIVVKLRELENARPAVLPVAHEKRYIPKLPVLHPQKCLYTFLTRFHDSMQAAMIPEEQWASRLRDLLTGQS